MNYINHITLNTGHIRKTKPNEVNKELYFILKRLYRDSLKEEVEIHKGYTMKSVQDSLGTVITVYSKEKSPILTTAISKTDTLGLLWKMMHDTPFPLATSPNKPITVPYIADRVEIGAIHNLDAMKWTGDFSRCMGWIILAPEKIRWE